MGSVIVPPHAPATRPRTPTKTLPLWRGGEEDGDGEEEYEEEDEDPTLLVSLELAPRAVLDASLQFSSKDASAGGALGLGELLKEVGIFRQGALATGGALKEAGQGKPGAFAVSSKEAG